MACMLMEKAGDFFGYQGRWKAGKAEHELLNNWPLCESHYQCNIKSMIVQFPQPTLSTQLCNISFLFSRETLPIFRVQIWAEYCDKRLTSRSTSEQARWAPYFLTLFLAKGSWCLAKKKIVDNLHSHMWTLRKWL